MSIMSDEPDTVSAIYSAGQRTLYAAGQRTLNLDSLPQVINRNTDGSINYIDVTDRDGAVFRQTWMHTNGQLSGFSAWERQ
jgi:hypothetical protein